MKCFLNGQPYKGEAAYINGFNGYESTEDDGMLCALINNSCWDSNGKPNTLKDENGNDIVNKQLRGTIIYL